LAEGRLSGFVSGLGENAGDYASAELLLLSVFSGSVLWWLLLSFGISHVRERVTSQWLPWINRGSSGIIFTFGITAVLNYLSQV